MAEVKYGLGWGLLALATAAVFGYTTYSAVQIGKRRPNPYRATWRDYIRGEWWLLPDGSSEFADHDNGDVPGHAAQAQDAILDRDTLVEGLVEEGVVSEEAARYLETASQVLNEHEREIDDKLGAAAIRVPPTLPRSGYGRVHLWHRFRDDPEVAYLELWGAIRVAGRAFQAHHYTADSIRAMQNFLLDLFAEGDAEPDGSKITIEDMAGNYAELPIAEFLAVKHPRDIGF